MAELSEREEARFLAEQLKLAAHNGTRPLSGHLARASQLLKRLDEVLEERDEERKYKPGESPLNDY